MKGSHYTPESPEVATILNGVWKSGIKTYYRIDGDGKHIDVRIREELIAALGISTRIATGLLQQANLPCAPYICTRALKAQTVPKVEPEEEIELDEPDEDGEPEFPAPEIKASPSSSKGKKLTVEERDEKALAVEEALNNRRYHYVSTSSGKHGIFDSHDGRTIAVFWTRDEAIDELLRLKTGKSGVVTFTGSSTVKPGVTY